MWEEDLVKYRKKKKKKSVKKAKHKHDYEDVILKEKVPIYGYETDIFFAGKRCKTCRKLSLGFCDGISVSVHEFGDRITVREGVSFNVVRISPKYLHLPVVEVHDIFVLNKEVN